VNVITKVITVINTLAFVINWLLCYCVVLFSQSGFVFLGERGYSVTPHQGGVHTITPVAMPKLPLTMETMQGL